MKANSETSKPKKRSVKIWIALVLILLVIALLAALYYGLNYSFFYGNQRFTITSVQIKGNGFWKDKKDLLCDILRIKPGVTNLFSIDPGLLRKRLLQREPSIQFAKLTRILPDTLKIEILERIPVALVNSPRSSIVVDSSSILLRKDRCMDISYSLPVIVGLPNASNYPAGSKVKQFEPAVQLIMLTRTSYPDIRIAGISIVRKNTLFCGLFYKNQSEPKDMYRVQLPTKDLPRHLRALTTVLEQMRNNNSPKRSIDLRFKNQAIIKP